LAKKWQAALPFAIGKNERYDRYTRKIIFNYCNTNSNCIDIGANEGKILSWMIAAASDGKHFAFEPIPSLNKALKLKFGSKAQLSAIALSNQQGLSAFNLVRTDPALSGLLKRPYPSHYQEEQIEVMTDLLDHIIDPELKISLIKMDVEGGEWNVLLGAIKTIKRNKPLILFECGKLGGDLYGFNDAKIFQLFNENLNYQIYTLEGWINAAAALSSINFAALYENGQEYFFVAAPIDNTPEML
jgi:FkbM family methyltransferase